MLKIIGTYNKPSIEFNTEKGELFIEGISLTVNAIEFYKPLLYSIAEYKKKPQLKTTAHFKLTYFNTSSSKSILDILRELEALNANSDVIINWYYEKADTDMLELGKNYRMHVNLPFCMIAIEPVKTPAFSFF
jgi:riboflavin synthase alpha subunit